MNHPTPSPVPSAAPAAALPLLRLLLVLVLLILAGLAFGFFPRWQARRQLVRETQADGIPTVNIVLPVPFQASLGTAIPAEVQAFVAAPIYARASGYLQRWLVDLGDHVTNGQVLAEIVTPELDEQFDQARAERDQMQAALNLAQVTADRWAELLKTASVSEQEAAEKSADLALKKAQLAAAQANLNRLTALKNFDRVTAPFDGVITERATDVGQLITADAGRPLFQLAQTDPLRVYVKVPQTVMHDVAPGQSAEVTCQDQPGRHFTAKVVRTAGAVDATSRTLLVELALPNPKGEIFAGSYAQVRFNTTPGPATLRLSDNTLITRGQGIQVAVVAADNTVHLRMVEVGRDYGNTVEILSGLRPGEQVIDNPPDAVSEGMTVQVAAAPSAPAK